MTQRTKKGAGNAAPLSWTDKYKPRSPAPFSRSEYQVYTILSEKGAAAPAQMRAPHDQLTEKADPGAPAPLIDRISIATSSSNFFLALVYHQIDLRFDLLAQLIRLALPG